MRLSGPDGQQRCGKFSKDGKSHGILRHTHALAYGHDLMYQWASRVGSLGIAWFTMWSKVVTDIMGLNMEDKRELLNLSPHFQEATINFVHLQRIGFDPGFRCPNGARDPTVDGIRSLFLDGIIITDTWSRKMLH